MFEDSDIIDNFFKIINYKIKEINEELKVSRIKELNEFFNKENANVNNLIIQIKGDITKSIYKFYEKTNSKMKELALDFSNKHKKQEINICVI